MRTDWPDTAITLQRLASTYMSVPKKSKHASPYMVHKSPKSKDRRRAVRMRHRKARTDRIDVWRVP